MLTVDWMSAVKDEEKKTLLLIPWEDGDFSDKSSAHTFVLTDEFFSVRWSQLLTWSLQLNSYLLS